MCGIYGAITLDKSPLPGLKKATDHIRAVLHHRGPNDNGMVFMSEKQAFEINGNQNPVPELGMLGNTRLSVIDLSKAGLQPMQTPDKRWTLVFNGEIYNYKELRQELSELAYSFKTRTDTEVLLYAFVHWGLRCLRRLVGMFAFAIHDSQTHTLFCVRDFFGIKPFYYYKNDQRFVFASEVSALLQFPWIDRRLNFQNAINYLSHGIIEANDSTLICDVFQIPAAHYIEINLETGKVSDPCRYWHIDLNYKQDISFTDAAQQLRELFLNSIKLHLRSDVPVGVALSGGIDSSSIVCGIREVAPDTPIYSFGYVAESSTFCEEQWIDIAARASHATCVKVTVPPGDLIRDLDKLIFRLGEPFAGTSIYAIYRVFKEASQHGIVVMLEGQGADELLAGYDGFCKERVLTLLHQKKYRDAFFFLNKAAKWPDRRFFRLVKRVLNEFLPMPSAALDRWINIKTVKDAGLVVNGNGMSMGPYSHTDKVRETLANFIFWEKLPNLLRHSDRNAMTFSIENRVPFLTLPLAEFLLSLPESYLIDMNGRSKSVFREAMRGIVPDVVLDRKDKIGYRTPEENWLIHHDQFVRESFQATDSLFIDKNSALQEWQAICHKKMPYDSKVWRWINYLRWKEIFRISE